MRSCPREAVLREAFAAETPLDPPLEAHVATCEACARIRAQARRFEDRLDAAVAEMVTDALPAATLPAARAGRVPASGGGLPRVLLGIVATAALASFAVIGVISVGASISDAMRGVGAAPSVGGDAGDCHLGDPDVEVTSEVLATDQDLARVAYCIGVTVGEPRELVCAAQVRPARPQDLDAHLEACSRVVDVEDVPPDGRGEAAASIPLGSWDAAADRVGWPLRRPGWVPDGYQLAALQGFFAPEEAGGIESVLATYLRNGIALGVEQFAISDPETFRIELNVDAGDLTEISTGQTTVDGRTAFWASGVGMVSTGLPSLDRGSLLLTWSDGRTGFRITSGTLDLETLQRVADSLAPG